MRNWPKVAKRFQRISRKIRFRKESQKRNPVIETADTTKRAGIVRTEEVGFKLAVRFAMDVPKTQRLRLCRSRRSIESG